MMQLPGGLYIDGVLDKRFLFKPVTGQLEMALSESALLANSLPARVTKILSEALEMLAGDVVSEKQVRALSVGDRQFLMHRLAIHIDDALLWLTARCGECGEAFDISLRLSELPVKLAGDAFPATVVEMPSGRLKVRVPTGDDQESIASVRDDSRAMQMLLTRLISFEITTAEDEVFDLASLDEAQLTTIETAVEAMAPEVASEMATHCPHCEMENRIPISPYGCMTRSVGELFSEIHALAANYHWSEQEILALPRGRRHTYLSLLGRQQGMQSRGNHVDTGWP
ncbi:MAG: hypothetical protein L3J89_11335 [Gammaproteobacteria bacterium]|nr:hypothetical protein [Gammaproteobacteria bacterium]